VLLAKMPPFPAEVLVGIHDVIGRNGTGNAFYLYFPVLLTENLVPDIRERLVGNEDFTSPLRR
jgi:hypothetical protein